MTLVILAAGYCTELASGYEAFIRPGERLAACLYPLLTDTKLVKLTVALTFGCFR